MKTKLFAVAIATTLSVGALAGCGAEDTTDPTPVGTPEPDITETTDPPVMGDSEQAEVAASVDAFLNQLYSEAADDKADEIEDALDKLVTDYGSIEAAPEEEKEKVLAMNPLQDSMYFGDMTTTEQLDALQSFLQHFGDEGTMSVKDESLIEVTGDTAIIPVEAFTSSVPNTILKSVSLIKQDGKWLMNVPESTSWTVRTTVDDDETDM